MIAKRWEDAAESGLSGTNDIIARQGGDEFTLIVRNYGSDKELLNTVEFYAKTTAAMDEHSKNEWCRSHGIYPQELEQWRLSAEQGLGAQASDSGGVSTRKQDRKRIQALERELRRKEKALAETAALLVLSKKLEAMMREDGEE